jgi:hypothetical protein
MFRSNLQVHLKNMKAAVIVAISALFFVSACMLAITLVGNEISKDQEQGDSGIMTVKGTDTVVKVGSSDFSVASDGSLVTRPSTNTAVKDGRRRLGVDQSTNVIKTAPKLTAHALTSTVPNK